MTEGPPPEAASSSKTSSRPACSSPGQIPTSTLFSSSPLVSNRNGETLQHYSGKTYWPTEWSPEENGYPPGATTNPGSTPQTEFNGSSPYGTHMNQAHLLDTPHSPQPAQPKPVFNSSPKSRPTKTLTSSPPPLAPQTFKDWDEVVKKFLLKTKMTEALKGFESDMLVINPEWERKLIPEALMEMVVSLQAILDRIAGKMEVIEDVMEIDSELDIMNTVESDEVDSLNDRKLKYVHLSNGAVPRSQSSVNKSISQFLSRTRDRNDASNRAEFLYTLAEKKRKIAESGHSLGGDINPQNSTRISSCARVDAKTIDRAKQMKYDIAKYGEGPLVKTVKPAVTSPSFSNHPASDISSTFQPQSGPTEEPGNAPNTSMSFHRKRKLVLDSDEEEGVTHVEKPSRKRKGKRKEIDIKVSVKREAEDGAEEKGLSMATAEKHPGLDGRFKDVEAHLAIRYVPTPPRTLLSRLQFLEEHIAKLEKEYPPWAALHFNQPNRGWPPPPRATPIIVPPHLRTFTTTSATSLSTPAPPASMGTSTTPIFTPGNSSGNAPTAVKPKKAQSSLHKAVLERMEVQRARSEMGAKGGHGLAEERHGKRTP